MTFAVKASRALALLALTLHAAGSFAQCPTSAPTPVSPVPGQTGVSTNTTLKWNASGAAKFDVFAADSTTCPTTPIATVSATQFSFPAPLDPGKTYSWLVVPYDAAGTTRCTAQAMSCASFQTLATSSCNLPGSFNLSGPADKATLNASPTFTWSASTNADKYVVHLLNTATAAETLSPAVSTTSYTPPALSNGTYSWYVQAFAACDTTRPTQSSVRTFSIAPASGTCPTDPPAISSPTNGASLDSTSSIRFAWTGTTGATTVELLLSSDGGQTFNVRSSVSGSAGTTSLSSLQPGAWLWYLRVTYPSPCAQINSARQSFTVTSSADSCPTNPGTPSLTAPADGAINVSSPVTFQWSGAGGAKGYSVVASVNGGTRYVVGATTSTSLTASVPQGTIAWSVIAGFGDSCATTVSRTSTFTVATPTQCSTTPATLISPANNATTATSPVTFQWSAVAGAAQYILYVSTGDEFDDVAETTSTTVTRIMPAGTISWYVMTKFATCTPVQSATSHFTIAQAVGCGSGTLTLASPADNATITSPAAFSWSAVSGASSYRLWIAPDGGPPTNFARTTATSATASLPSGKFEWYVEALFDTCPSVVSADRKFSVQSGANCGSNPPPVLVSPTGANGTSVTFQWTGSSQSVGYRIWLAPAGQPFGDVAFTKSTQLTQTLAAGSYTWYVEALYENCAPVQSARGQFTVATATAQCSGQAPVLFAPIDGATSVTSPVRFAWSKVSDATGYRLFAGDEGTNEKLVLAGQTDSDTASITRAMPAGTIRWRVEAVFANCPSTKSAESKFTVLKSQNCPTAGAQLLAPANDATISSQPVNFDWSDVNGASGYVLMVRVNAGAPTPLAETTESHLARAMPEGEIAWWVVTFVSGCGPLESPHFSFTVPATSCSTKKPLVTAPRDDEKVTSPVTFSWTAVPNATKYKLRVVDANGAESVLATTAQTETKQALPEGRISWFVEAEFASCPAVASAKSDLKVVAATGCTTPAKPVINAPGQVVSGSAFTVRWSASASADRYELQESPVSHFGSATTTVVSGNKAVLTRTATGKPAQYFFRVRAVSNCADERSAYSDVIAVTVVPVQPAAAQQHVSAEFGNDARVVQTIFLPGQTAGVNFTASSDKPWITISPSSGPLPTTGITLTVTADTSALTLGTTSATIRVSYSTGPGASALATTSTPIPLSVSLVTAVTPGGKNTPPPDSLIIPAVAHASGVAGSLFESDIRVANTSATTMKYLVNFTPSGVDGTATGNSTTIQVDPGQTLALDDILASFFGTTTSTLGVLEIRPLASTTASSAFTSSAQSRTTVASSRTYNVTSNGTFGQFIPAIPFSQFVGSADGILSLQQVAQSAAYRTNLGLVEGAGEPATVRLTVFDNSGTVLGTIDQSLKAGEHVQLNGVLAANNISLADGRIEVQVTSPTGRVSAYASTVDNITNDPLMVSPVLKSIAPASRYVLPGIGDFNSGFAHWKSDVRIFNAGATGTTVTLAYYPQGHADTPTIAPLTIKPGEVKAIDNFIATVMPSAGTGTAGSLVVSYPPPPLGQPAPPPPTLIVTARTYTDTGNGTYGQFIPAVTVADSVGLGDRTLQILQLEQSTRMRTNVGVTETSGNAASVEISVLLPDSRVTPRVTLSLKPNEFVQIPLAGLVPDGTYNARVAVRVTSGTGRVTAYGSVIDQVTQDPTYVPAQ
jgi:hypothetical protein